jgi:CHAT domain-containing protein
LLPFDLVRAHDLYRLLFGKVGDLIKDKRLLVVPSGPLTVLPFQVLVTEQPAQGADYANTAWLPRTHAITVLPSVSSLKALRQLAKASKATKPFIGFGNPLLLGPNGNDRRAWARQTCSAPSTPSRVAARGIRLPTPAFFRNGLANVELVRAQYPLPETTDELCAVAQSTGAGSGDVYLGEEASEKTVKSMSVSGSLARARVVHFATHGLLAGETEMLAAVKAEPALILTPPQQATADDDGLLTASEVAQLKLDADWVVLSACNTAASADKPGADALSGLARAFFYAGARALLVSHWAVDSQATVGLITKTFSELKSDPKIGRAEALRRAMLHLIDSNDRLAAHPTYWAPFVLVGEGAH